MEFDFEHADDLIAAALDEFSRLGYAGASINRILQQAGMSKGQFYYHFDHKEALFLAVLELLQERKRVFWEEVLAPHVLEADLFQALETRIRFREELDKRHPEFFPLCASLRREKDHPVVKRAMETHGLASQDDFQKLVERSFERGEFRSDLPTDFIQHILNYLMNQLVEILDIDGSDPEQMDSRFRHFISFLRTGLSNNQPPSPSTEPE